MSYSEDFRSQVLSYIDSGGSKKEACKIFGISEFAIYYWLKIKAKTGGIAFLKPKRSWKKLDPVVLESYVSKHADLTLKEYAEHFGVHISAIGAAFKRLKITRKKRQHYTKKDVKRSERYIWSGSASIKKRI